MFPYSLCDIHVQYIVHSGVHLSGHHKFKSTEREEKNIIIINIAGVALFLDFMKAFDSLEWNFLMKCLKKFKFKDSFCQWIQIIYSQCKASVNVNGYLTQTINMRRGIRQGCPLSGLLFILCAEFLCLHIKQANSYKGIDLDLGKNMVELKITVC